MDWDKLKKDIDVYNSDISKFQIQINKDINNIKEINKLKNDLNRKREDVKIKIRNIKELLINLSKQIKKEIENVKAKKLQYILSKGNLVDYSDDKENVNKLEEIRVLINKNRNTFKNLSKEEANIQRERNQLDETVDYLKKQIRDHKDQINSLQQLVAKSSIEHDILEFTRLDSNSYKLILRQNIYNLKTTKIISNERDYFFDGEYWYLCRENKSDKKINNKNKIETLNNIFNELKK